MTLTASRALQEGLCGPAGPASVLAAFPAAVYLAHRGGVVAVLTTDAVRLPNAVVVARDSSMRPFAGLGAGAGGVVGGGLVAVAGRVLATVDARTDWFEPRPAVGLMAPGLHTRLRELASAMTAPWLDPHAGLPHAAALAQATQRLDVALGSREPTAIAAAAHGLVGLGPGLTPAGDDVLAGVLAAGRLLASEDRPLAALAAATAALRHRTTTLAATLTAHAARGEVAIPFGTVVLALTGRGSVRTALAGLLAVGHTSGHDLATGLALGARLALAPPTPRTRTPCTPSTWDRAA